MSVDYTRQYRPVRTGACVDGRPMSSGILCEWQRTLNNAYKYRHRPVMLWQSTWPMGFGATWSGGVYTAAPLAPATTNETYWFHLGPMYVPPGYTSLRVRAQGIRNTGATTLTIRAVLDSKNYTGSPTSATWTESYLQDQQDVSLSLSAGTVTALTGTAATVPCSGLLGSRLGQQAGAGVVWGVVTYQCSAASGTFTLYDLSVVAEP